MQLIESSAELYQMDLPFDYVYQIMNEKQVPIGLVYISDIDDKNIYVEWIEILTVFRGCGYLRQVFSEINKLFRGKIINLECSEELLRKYISIGCEEHGVNECTENYILTYENKIN